MNMELIDSVIEQYRESMVKNESKEAFLLRMRPVISSLSEKEYLLTAKMLLSAGKGLTTTH